MLLKAQTLTLHLFVATTELHFGNREAELVLPTGQRPQQLSHQTAAFSTGHKLQRRHPLATNGHQHMITRVQAFDTEHRACKLRRLHVERELGA